MWQLARGRGEGAEERRARQSSPGVGALWRPRGAPQGSRRRYGAAEGRRLVAAERGCRKAADDAMERPRVGALWRP